MSFDPRIAAGLALALTPFIAAPAWALDNSVSPPVTGQHGPIAKAPHVLLAQAQRPAPTSAQPAPGPLPQVGFVTSQKQNEWRVTELDGLDVYDSNGEEVGEIEDALVDDSGRIGTVVIEIGGVAGIGGRLIGVPFDKIQWNTSAVGSSDASTNMDANRAPPASPAGSTARGNADAFITTGGIPRRPTLPLSKADIDKAPAFAYAGRTQPNPSQPGASQENTGGNRLAPPSQPQR
ncbi:PRC-barrel domain-containing protein [Chelatococcus sp. GCM10030263]|uniref:PRC-barrel domain-containing protein n=1 Tax=Chelatococcus sp. GCM10030263 TaxID=3273387 RepID=UPI0036156494